MNLDRNSLKQLVQEEIMGLLEQLPAATTTPAGTTPTDPRNKVPTPPPPPPPPGGTAGALAATATGMKALSNVAAATGAAADVQAARGAAALANVPEVSDEEFAAAEYKGPLIATESTMKLSRNNLKLLVQEEIMGLLEADPAAALRASLASEEEPKGRGHYLPKEEPEPEPESEEGAPKRQRVVRTRGRGNEPSERELRRAMAASRERLDVPEGKLHRESTMKLTRNDLKQLVQEETGVLLEAPPIDTSQVQQSAKVTQVLRIIDGMKPEDVQSLIQALQQLGLVPPPA